MNRPSSHTEAVSLLKRLIAIPSLSGEEGPVADFLQGYIENAGVPVERVDNNIQFSLGNGEKMLLLNSHLDVVPPSGDHPYPPFEPIEVNGSIYGRGSADAKGCVTAITRAFLELSEEGFEPPAGKVTVALTVCEESGHADNGMMNLRKLLPTPVAALVGEPTNLQPCVAQKGLLILKLTARGKTAHAARAHLGENAITKAARDILKLESTVFDREDPFLGKPTVAVTTVEAGTARNVIPDECTFYVDIRSTPAYTHPELVNLISDAVQSDLDVHSDRIVPVATDINERIVQACIRAVPGARPFGSPTTSDWIFLHDVPTVKIGPGASEVSHTAGEHLPTIDLIQAVEVYKSIIREYFAPANPPVRT